MGFVKDTLFGKGQKIKPGYEAPYFDTTTRGGTEGAYRRAGVQGNLGNFFKSGDASGLDFSQVGAGPSQEELAGESAKVKPIFDIASQLRSPSIFKETYNPYQFDYKGLGDEFGNKAYSLGSKNITRTFGDTLRQQKEAAGTRRPGLFAKLTEKSNQALGSSLGDLAGNIGLETLRSNVDAEKAQQLAQAGEEYKGYSSRADLENKRADDEYRRLTGAAGLYGSGTELESGLQQLLREDKDKGLALLLDLLNRQQGYASQQKVEPAEPGAIKSFANSIGKAAGAAAGGFLFGA